MVIFDTMKFLKALFAFYINSSIHVAFAVLALLALTVFEFNLSITNELWVFVFLGALTGYNFVKYAKIAGLHHRSLTNSLKTIQIFSAGCFILLVYLATRLSVNTLLVTATFGLTTFFYAVPFVRHKSLRKFSGIKIFVVAIVWAGVTVIVPMVSSGAVISASVLLTFFQRILIVVALILPFEIRDVPYDALNLNTLPQQVGVKTTRLIGLGVLVLSVIFEFFKESLHVTYSSSLLFFCIILSWLLMVSKTKQSRYFASFWVEGMPVLWVVLFLLFDKF